VNYINHNRTQANIRIRWAQDFAIAHDDRIVQEGTIRELEQTKTSLVAFDYIATRDIQQGEELYLDYGNEWEDAWQEHVRTYQSAGPDGYASASSWNTHFDDMMLRTVEEQPFDPYPEHIQIRCHSKLMRKVNPKIRPPHKVQYVWERKDYGEPCRILDRFWEEGSYWYTVQLEIWPDEDDDEDDQANKDETVDTEPMVTWIERTDVPRSAIRFFDRPGTTDLHLPNAFRHAIYIPDDMFPEQWRDFA
jgi:hypothetical protein